MKQTHCNYIQNKWRTREATSYHLHISKFIPKITSVTCCMQCIGQNMNILPRFYWADERIMFNCIQYILLPKNKKKKKFQCRCALLYTGRVILSSFNKLRLIYFNVSDITFLCLELFERLVKYTENCSKKAYNTEGEFYEFNKKIIVHSR